MAFQVLATGIERSLIDPAQVSDSVAPDVEMAWLRALDVSIRALVVTMP